MATPTSTQQFLIRTDAGWSLTDSSSNERSPVDLAKVRELLRTGSAPSAAHAPEVGSQPDPRALLRDLQPRWSIAGRLVPGGIQIEDRSGVPQVVGLAEVELIELSDEAGDLSMEGSSPPGTADRVRRLVELGLLEPVGTRERSAVDPHPPSGHTPEPERDPGHPDRRVESRRPGGLWRRLGRWPQSGLRRHRPLGPIPVFSIWDEEAGPALSLGMLLAAARAHDGGRLSEHIDLRPMQTRDEFLDSLATHDGPAVLLCSNYLWSVEANLAAARAAHRINPELIVIHGGPSTPAYEDEAEAFLREHREVAHVLVRGEGERALCEVLERLASGSADLADVAGITFVDDSGQIVRTEDRDRIAALSELPSPYLTGEFDHLEPTAWPHGLLHIETNRGCPYGCTFCDWGSATMSRVRRFEVERVLAEARWGQQRGFTALNLCDANFGLLPQDEQIADELVRLRHETGFPMGLALTLAKNSTSRVIRVVEKFLEGGMPINSCVSLQSVDPTTVAAVHRDNIDVDTYLALAALLRRWGYGLQSDMILGLPGQTLDSFRRDMQFMFDHEIMARTWPARLLPNSPMNEPGYRTEHDIRSDEFGVVDATATLSAEDRDEALHLRNVGILLDRYGLMRHVLRLLQWDHGLAATDVEQTVLRTCREHPDRYPLLSWSLLHFEHHANVPVGWSEFYCEVGSFVRDELGLEPSSTLETVLAVQRALMPAPGRTFPHRTELAHDYVAYYLSAIRSLHTTGRAGEPDQPLQEYGPGELIVEGDPFGLCARGMTFGAATHDGLLESDFHLGAATANELLSPLVRILPVLGAMMGPMIIEDRLRRLELRPEDLPALEATSPIAVHLRAPSR